MYLSNVDGGFVAAAQGAVTIAVRYGAARQQFGPPDAPEISVLDYTSQQEKLMPMLATAYALHFTTRYLVSQYTEAKRTKEEEIIADVHALSAGAHCHVRKARLWSRATTYGPGGCLRKNSQADRAHQLAAFCAS